MDLSNAQVSHQLRLETAALKYCIWPVWRYMRAVKVIQSAVVIVFLYSGESVSQIGPARLS